MKQMLDQVRKFIQSVGMRNFMIGLFILCMILISGLYATFSLSTFSSGVVVSDSIKTLKFILGDNSSENMVMLAENSSKSIAVTVSNRENIPLMYGVYYASSDDLKDVEIGYRATSEYLPNGKIEASSDYIITIRIVNHSDSIKSISFGVVYGLLDGGDLVISDGQHFLEREKNFPLSEVKKGSYVSYVGNYGCVEKSCSGVNANSVDVGDLGFCGDENTSFLNDGFRVAYIKNGYVYLVSAGGVECLKQEASSNDDMIKKLNDTALKYCNVDYSYLGVCDERSAWAINLDDYYYMTGRRLDVDYCFLRDKDSRCGYENDLIDVGSYYWMSSVHRNNVLYYQPYGFRFQNKDLAMGVRPIIRLSDHVVVDSGDGTKEHPYVIKNTVVSDYEYRVVYNGNGATSGDVEDSLFKTNVSYSLNKNLFEFHYQVKYDDLAIFDDSYCDDNDVCFESSVPAYHSGDAKFLGWSIHPEDKNPMYLDEEKVINLSNSSEEVIVNLYAVWDSDVLEMPAIQEREGYEILGWYTERDGGEKIGNPSDEYTGEIGAHLYARWEKKI